MPEHTIDFLQRDIRMNEIERRSRIELAACYRLVAKYGMTDLIYNHISLRIPDTDHQLLINPFGLFYHEITASSLIKIDIEGKILAPGNTKYGVNRAGYIIHGAVHRSRPDVQCVIHTHTTAGVAVSAMPDGLLPISQTALRFIGRTGYHDYEGPSVDVDERTRLAAALGSNNALILRNHGLLTCGRSVAEAFFLMQRLETACRIQVATVAAGPPQIPSAESQARTIAMFSADDAREGVSVDGAMEWESFLRALEQTDPSYKE
jgi:ribulose-5-phosphate 4-epimerase/fuculose-1-phosphate aldolase